MESQYKSPFSFILPENGSNKIKVVGVGGGGSNAVNYMYGQGIVDVDFVVCNTDAQALHNSPIPVKIQLGTNLTEGMGAGARPEIGRLAAEENVEDLKSMFGPHTKMAFITAGMGGGTGTGAAPVIAKIAREMGILTVGIVTTPFGFEGPIRKRHAEIGLEQMRKYVDSLIVVNNDRLIEYYGDLVISECFSKADEILCTGAKGIAEVITNNMLINIDLNDAKTLLHDSGTALMGSARARGDNKAKAATEAALASPLLNNNDITGAHGVLLMILYGKKSITGSEMNEINFMVQKAAGGKVNIIQGMGPDEGLADDEVSVTLIATGFPDEKSNAAATISDGRNNRDTSFTVTDASQRRAQSGRQPGSIRRKADEKTDEIRLDLFSNVNPDEVLYPSSVEPEMPGDTHTPIYTSEAVYGTPQQSMTDTASKQENPSVATQGAPKAKIDPTNLSIAEAFEAMNGKSQLEFDFEKKFFSKTAYKESEPAYRRYNIELGFGTPEEGESSEKTIYSMDAEPSRKEK